MYIKSSPISKKHNSSHIIVTAIEMMQLLRSNYPSLKGIVYWVYTEIAVYDTW